MEIKNYLRIFDKMKSLSKEEIEQLFKDCGILDKNGDIAKPYRISLKRNKEK